MSNPAPRETVIALRDAIADVLLAEFERIMGYLTRRLAKDIADDVDAALGDYDWHDFGETLQQPDVLQPLQHAYLAGANRAQVELGLIWGLRDPRALAYARDRAAELAGMRRLPDGRLVPNPSARWSLAETTRATLRDLVVDLLEAGTSWRDLKTAIEALPAFTGLFGEYRAEMIARTEVALAANHGALDGYAAAGVDRVRVIDGAECGWRFHDDPDKADGTIRTVAEAREHPIAHPHCVRAFTAYRPAKMVDVTAGITVGTGLVGYELEGQRPPRTRRDPRCLACQGIRGAPCICPEEQEVDDVPCTR